MYPLFESICLTNGRPLHIAWHQLRYERSYHACYSRPPSDLITSDISIPDFARRGGFKMRISYNETAKKAEFEKYELKSIRTLKMIEDDQIEYNLKYSDRTQLRQLFSQKGNCDDILIIKNGLVTDSSYCNIVFFDGEEWITPATPLLRGTARERLLHSGRIREAPLRKEDIRSFAVFKLINAMRDFKVAEAVEVGNIRE